MRREKVKDQKWTWLDNDRPMKIIEMMTRNDEMNESRCEWWRTMNQPENNEICSENCESQWYEMTGWRLLRESDMIFWGEMPVEVLLLLRDIYCDWYDPTLLMMTHYDWLFCTLLQPLLLYYYWQWLKVYCGHYCESIVIITMCNESLTDERNPAPWPMEADIDCSDTIIDYWTSRYWLTEIIINDTLLVMTIINEIIDTMRGIIINYW